MSYSYLGSFYLRFIQSYKVWKLFLLKDLTCWLQAEHFFDLCWNFDEIIESRIKIVFILIPDLENNYYLRSEFI